MDNFDLLSSICKLLTELIQRETCSRNFDHSSVNLTGHNRAVELFSRITRTNYESIHELEDTNKLVFGGEN